MSTFDLDMAFEPAEIAAELERLFAKLRIRWSCERKSPSHYEFVLDLPDAGQTQLVVRPLPVERMTYLGMFPRTLLEAHAANSCDLGSLRREILLAFLRVTG